MSMIDFVTTIIGIDPNEYPEFMHIFVGIAGALFIILFSTIVTLIGIVGGTFSPKKY